MSINKGNSEDLEKSKRKDGNSTKKIWIIILLIIIFLMYQSAMKKEEEARNSNPYLEPTTAAIRQATQKAGLIIYLTEEASNSSVTGGCPYGCKFHKPDCDIKGNISFETMEKIYHVPGGNFYDRTEIDSDAGERWFCTEEEAIDNGWRRSEK